MKHPLPLITLLLLSLPLITAAELPIVTGEYTQHLHKPYTTDHGLIDINIRQLRITEEGKLLAHDASDNILRFNGKYWSKIKTTPELKAHFQLDTIYLPMPDLHINDFVRQGEKEVIASDAGLFIYKNDTWKPVYPHQRDTRWAPNFVKAVTFDHEGRLCFASKNGLGIGRYNEFF